MLEKDKIIIEGTKFINEIIVTYAIVAIIVNSIIIIFIVKKINQTLLILIRNISSILHLYY